MKPFTRFTGKPVAAIAMALLTAAVLAACGGHSLYGGNDEMPMVDAYFSAVSAIAASSPDDTEPAAIDTIVATAPDDTEPQPLG